MWLAKFNGKIEMSNVNAPESYTLGFDGSGGVAGFGKGVSQVKLTPNEQGTMLDYSVNAQVGGKIAQMGQRLIDGVAKSMADDFFARFDGVLQERFPKIEVAKTATNSGTLASEVSESGQNANGSGALRPAQLAQTKPTQKVPKTVWIMLAVGIFIIAYFIKR
jgi:uncharacterized protein